jgi:hypothetical protein
MSNQLTLEMEFRLNRLSVRLERLARHFGQLGAIVSSGEDSARGLVLLQDCKLFIEWTGVDLDVDRAYELLQMQRQLVQWQRNWDELWRSNLERSVIDQVLQAWAVNINQMMLVLA